jgi:hypothetical protein
MKFRILFLAAALCIGAANAQMSVKLTLQHRIPFINHALDLDTFGDVLYIASGSDLLWGKIDGNGNFQKDDAFLNFPEIHDLARQGNNLYVASNRGVSIVDLSEPNAPIEIGLFEDSAVTRVFPDSLRLFAVQNDVNLLVLDVHDSHHPVLTASLSNVAGNTITGLASFGDTLFMATEDSGIAVVHMAQGDSFELVGRIESTTGYRKLMRRNRLLLGLVVEIDWNGEYGASRHDSGLKLFSIADPSRPTEIDALLFSPGGGVDVVWTDSLAFLLCGSYLLGDIGFYKYELKTVSLSNGTGLRLLDSLSIAELAYEKLPQQMVLHNQRLWIAQMRGLAVLDVSNPASAMLEKEILDGVIARSIDANQSFLAVMDDEQGLHFYDRSDPAHPRALTTLPAMHGYGAVKMQNNMAYAVSVDGGFRIFALQDSIQELAHIDLPGSARDLNVTDSFAFVADGEAGLTIIDISNPKQPAVIGRAVLDQRTVSNVRVVDGYAVVTYDRFTQPGFGVIDVSNPEKPVEIFSENRADYVKGLCVADNRIYVEGDYGAITIYDFTNPRSPALIGQIQTANYSNHEILVEDNILYAAGQQILVYDVHEPSQPRWLDGVAASALSIAKKGDYLYVATALHGIKTYKVDITTNAGDENYQTPFDFHLQQNYPNPFNAGTIIAYEIPQTSHVKLTVHDLLGREVAILVDETQNSGRHRVVWNGASMASGIYFYALQVRNGVEKRKLVLLR